jgi:hypothetical protein
MGGWEAEASSEPGEVPNPHRRELPLEPLLSNWLTSGSVGGTMNGSSSMTSEVQIPFPIRLTLNQLLDLADETELRAVTLRWMGGSRTPASQKAHSLLQIAAELRQTAERLLSEVWIDSSQSSLR